MLAGEDGLGEMVAGEKVAAAVPGQSGLLVMVGEVGFVNGLDWFALDRGTLNMALLLPCLSHHNGGRFY